MSEFLTLVFGPLVSPECKRAAARGWPILVRSLAAIVAAFVVVSVAWTWDFNAHISKPALYLPYEELRFGIAALEFMYVTIALVLGPAVLAGSLSGDRDRGGLALLLTTRVSDREIVTGRLAGKLSQVVMILLCGLPPLAILASYAGTSLPNLVVLAALPVAVAVGGGGLALAASVVSKRGRDALMLVYMTALIFLVVPMIGGSYTAMAAVMEWLAPFNPFLGVSPLAWYDDPSAAVRSIGLWTGLGVVGTAVAAWRVRPSCLKQFGGESKKRKSGRGWIVPPVGLKPMLWKELYIERVASLGRVGKWIGVLLVLYLALTSLVLGSLCCYFQWIRPDAGARAFYASELGRLIADPALIFTWLIEWAVGLRAAVAISSERERNTWDAILTSPLEGGEIIRGKLWGSMFALKWLIVAAVYAWTTAWGCGAMETDTYLFWLGHIVIIGAFMAAVGVRNSLAVNTATRAMTLTVGMWLGGMAMAATAAGVIFAFGALLWFFLWMGLSNAGLAGPAGMWFPFTGYQTWSTLYLILFLAVTVMIVSETRLRFDRIAGRMSGGALEVAVDQLVYGPRMAPVVLGPAPDNPVYLGENDKVPPLDDLDFHEREPAPAGAGPLDDLPDLGPSPRPRPKTFRPGARDWS